MNLDNYEKTLEELRALPKTAVIGVELVIGHVELSFLVAKQLDLVTENLETAIDALNACENQYCKEALKKIRGEK